MSLTAERLREVIDYNPETGEFTWKPGSGGYANGSRAAGYPHYKGYRNVRVDGQEYKAHRLAWLHVYGVWPNGQIDHIDGNRANNTISNLREANQSQNTANSRLRSDSKTGFKGVSRETNPLARHKIWRARIVIDGRRVCLGRYETPEEAHEVYKTHALKHYGEFAKTG